MADFVVWLGLGPEERGGLGDVGEPLSERLTSPLIRVEGVRQVEDIHYAPDDRSALIPIVVADEVDLDDPTALGESLHAAVLSGLGGAPINVELYMAAPSGDPCPICGRVNGHDWSRHSSTANYAEGLTRL